ncbi:hypothetical protein CVT26_002850 [Gymnopilus dilepis]|uniref:Uncharacterized protein n=1 Tax=Gymnopilus dilepis TaxID=231916 RepID=A0A409Y371_9AGAR|nr:hypothetical protein CVT26_002850 [Gymnopilus dilepis]
MLAEDTSRRGLVTKNILVLWDKAKSFASRLLQPLFDYMAPTVTETLFPQVPTPVKSYVSSVFGTYIMDGEEHEVAKHYTVKEIRLYKCRKHPFHEYIIARVNYQNRNHSYYLRIERTRSRPKADVVEEGDFLNRLPNPSVAEIFREAFQEAKLDESDDDVDSVEETTPSPPATPEPLPSQTGSFYSNSISQSSKSLKSLNGLEAVDSVMGVDSNSFKDDERLETLHTTDLPLARLACLAKIVHDEDPSYSVFRHQCYWYANLIMKVIEKESKSSSKRKEGRVDNSISKLRLRLVKSPRGTWWRIPVGKVEKALVETISAQFEEAWGKHNQRLSALVNGNGNTVRNESDRIRVVQGGEEVEEENLITAGEESRNIEKERRQIDEQRRQMEEEKRQLEEERRRVGEERRQLEEERRILGKQL